MSLTIISPLYNENDIVVPSLNKIVDQLDACGIEAEIIIIDDHSTDGGFESVEALPDSRIKTYRTAQNTGSGGPPRNIGIRESRTEFVMFYDIGDRLNLEHVSAALGIMRELKVNISLFKHQDVHPGERILESPLKIFKDQVYPTNLSSSPQLISNPFSWSKIYNRKWLIENNIKFGDQYSGQDKVFTWHAYLEAHAILVVPRVMYQHVFFDDSRNRMTRVNGRLLQSLQSIDWEVRPLFRRRGMQDLYNYRLINRDILEILLGHSGIAKLANQKELDQVFRRASQWVNRLSGKEVDIQKYVRSDLRDRFGALLSNSLTDYISALKSGCR